MGILTRAQLIAQAGLAAGNDQSTAFVRTWLDAWLRRTAKSWAWPICKTRIASLPIAASAASVIVGAGNFTAVHIHRIFNPLLICTADFKQRGRMTIRELLDGNPDNDPDTTLAANRLGMPSTCKIRKSGDGYFTIYPDPVPDKAYLISLDVHFIPANIGATAAADTSIPWYEEDKTLIQACKCALLELDDGGEMSAAMEKANMILGSMVIDDRDFNGEAPGDGQEMALDRSVFT